ncbi:hypothetical protein COL922a_011856 [Colletotrichum nupharicola]|nr:hypothetical protein COL922a_011856 [Colletotrichum nupharicola]
MLTEIDDVVLDRLDTVRYVMLRIARREWNIEVAFIYLWNMVRNREPDPFVSKNSRGIEFMT